MKPGVVAKIYKKRFALHVILAPPTGFITQWTSKNQILIVKWKETSSPKGNDRSSESNVPTSSHFKQASK